MLWYMASPYARYKEGHEAAFRDASRAAALLMKRGLAVYSPIVHSHPIAIHGGIDPVNHEFWMNVDSHMMARCDGLAVVMMDGWEHSRGIAHEREAFQLASKPIVYYPWSELQE